MSLQDKIKQIHDVIDKSFKSELSSISVQKISFDYLDKSITLDFDTDFLRTLENKSINTLIKDLNLVDYITKIDTDFVYLFINENGITPYAGNRDLS